MWIAGRLEERVAVSHSKETHLLRTRSRRHLRSPCRARTPRITTVSRLVLQHSTHLVLVHLHRVDFGRLEDRRTRAPHARGTHWQRTQQASRLPNPDC